MASSPAFPVWATTKARACRFSCDSDRVLQISVSLINCSTCDAVKGLLLAAYVAPPLEFAHDRAHFVLLGDGQFIPHRGANVLCVPQVQGAVK